MNIYEDTNPRELKDLLRQIHAGDTVLPDFQRDFVWEPGATTELIISIAQNFPAGSLLRIRNTNNLFAYREFEGAPKVNGKKPIYLVLDGQQRLTSLYQAFYGVGEYRYYLNVKKLLGNSDFEDCIFNLRATHAAVKEYEKLDVQAQELVLPLSILKGGSGDFTKWLLNVASKITSGQEQIDLQHLLLKVESEWIRTIDDYLFPVVTLSDTTSAEAVCTIFETLNRTGVKLSPFELLTARFWHQSVNLRQLWSEAKAKYPIITDFGIDPYYLLQVISLIGSRTPTIKRSEIMNMSVTMIHNWWDKAVEGLNEALKFLQNECGILTPGLLPYNTIIIPLSAIFARLLHQNGPSTGTNRDKVSQWFWCAVFGQKYESSPTSQSALDFSEVIKWIGGGDIPETIRSFTFDSMILRDVTARQRAVYRGILALVLRHQSKDFYSNETLTLEVISKNHVDDHHIFPDKYLEKKGYSKRLSDCVLNHTLIDRDTNKRISARAPSDYMKEILNAWKTLPGRGEAKFNELLRSHLMPVGQASPLWKDDFDQFLQWRQDCLSQEIHNATGV